MNNPLIEDKVFKQKDFTEEPLPRGDYEYCQFINCRFFEADLRSFRFLETSFTGCDLSVAKLHKTAFKGIVFKDCKLTGLGFDQCDPFGLDMQFEGCNLTHSSFYGLSLKGIRFIQCILEAVEFSEANLQGAVFTGSLLTNAHFDRTNLEQADLRSATGFSINPTINQLKKASFSASALAGLVEVFGIKVDRSS
ncbi:pentapeptide repeat-containing protein [Flavihumibacter sp. CACIAM 22H1]|uniref:pentapeptide repeat-containing protein n=1 Tax=Flavihumibacter sp. CACIAM 22H1 TaxID=1812911 RepID=UPI0007A89493|nr:pentapeptide repeat-containing protein [Flavihumibacter sp. CACIAM 22H1]KYP13873.1 MAG: hypothetical protein A1D16_14755 [Flavihumibacter sp. CACIAM 22H1]